MTNEALKEQIQSLIDDGNLYVVANDNVYGLIWNAIICRIILNY